MLTIVIPETEAFNEATGEFVMIKEQTLKLEHSLVSLSKWESKWMTPFLNNQSITPEQTLDYIKCMTLTQNVNPYVYDCLTKENMKAISNYIESPMTATTIKDNRPGKGRQEIVTSELIYYWMIACNIPFECQKWHLNRLLMLIKVCSIKNDTSGSKKMGKRDILSQNRALNEARRARMKSRG